MNLENHISDSINNEVEKRYQRKNVDYERARPEAELPLRSKKLTRQKT